MKIEVEIDKDGKSKGVGRCARWSEKRRKEREECREERGLRDKNSMGERKKYILREQIFEFSRQK